MDGSCQCEDVWNVGKGFNKNGRTEGGEERENRMLDALIDVSHMFGRSQPRIEGANDDVWWKRMRERKN